MCTNLRDIRLVGAPPESVGKFGGDTDNWEWPRHTGDFFIFCVYVIKDGKPADFSKDNIPLKPNILPVSISVLKMGICKTTVTPAVPTVTRPAMVSS
jgi:hypothetical protein